VDPLAESFINLTPYNYVANNPILNFDPNGDTIVNHNHSAQFLNQEYANGLNVDLEKSPFSFGDNNKLQVDSEKLNALEGETFELASKINELAVHPDYLFIAKTEVGEVAFSDVINNAGGKTAMHINPKGKNGNKTIGTVFLASDLPDELKTSTNKSGQTYENSLYSIFYHEQGHVYFSKIRNLNGPNNGLNSVVQFGDVTRKLNNQKYLRYDHKNYKKTKK